MKKIVRNYLEIKSIKELILPKNSKNNLKIKLLLQPDFQLNKFLYKQIGKNYYWNDRLIWTDQDWIKYVSRKNVFTYILYKDSNIAGFFELIYHEEKKEIELAYLGLLHEFIGKKLGAYLLTEAIKTSWNFKINRVWVHTCSLDHPNALKNYLDRGMKIFNHETIFRNIA
jgi:GNAT superfamily N-acetyltransferase